MKIGIRAHDLGQGSAEQLAKIGAEIGIQAIQLAPAKALLPTISYAQMPPEKAQEIRGAFATAGIQIAVLGCYINPVHPDPSLRRLEIERFATALRLAKDFDCTVVATETGSFNLDGSEHPLNRSDKLFSILMESLSEMASVAERYGVKVGLEPALPHTLYSLESVQRALRTLNSEAMTVVFDPVNILEGHTLPNQRALFDRAINLFGHRISAIHAKDVILEGSSLRRVPPGQGVLDYPYLLTQLKNADLNPPLLMEETDGDALAPAIKFLLEMANQFSKTPQHP